MLALCALFTQIAAATPLPGAAGGHVAALRIDLPVCGLIAPAADGQAPLRDRSHSHDHLLGCARCLCCHAPAIAPEPTACPATPGAIVYVARVVLPPATAPPVRLAARPPPRAPPTLTARPD